jgi:UDP-N-acetylglucosamine--N-acetylmuramyl-(pentapeptide) pyrophosphoryl-undecaprenol N-acetylglucosamine transferase
MRVMIMAGGTGGHVFPALAVAAELRERGAEVFWLGTRQGLEAKVVPAAGISMEWVSVSGLRGKGLLAWLLAPWRLLWAVLQVLAVMLRQRPVVVLGMGGFVTGPGGVVTWLLRKPLVIHEQNAIAGLTNRLLAPLAQRVLEAFPGTFQGKHAVHTGNPVRRAIAELPAPEERFAPRSGALHLLVLGGSLGARALNEIVPAALKDLAVADRADTPPPPGRGWPAGPGEGSFLSRTMEIWHQAGSRHLDEARAHYGDAGVTARVEPFIDDMAAAYGWADLVVCRAGALTIAELAAAGVGAVLVPYPHAVDDHQTRNAAYLADAGAAVIVQQRELTRDKLRDLLASLIDRSRLLVMAQAARRLAKPQAAALVAEQCWEAAHG